MPVSNAPLGAKFASTSQGAPAGQKLAVGTVQTFSLSGPGLFLTARIGRQVNSGDIGQDVGASLLLDGKPVLGINFAAAKLMGFTQANPAGIQVLPGSKTLEELVFALPYPLRFESSLELRAEVLTPGIDLIRCTVLHAKE